MNDCKVVFLHRSELTLSVSRRNGRTIFSLEERRRERSAIVWVGEGYGRALEAARSHLAMNPMPFVDIARTEGVIG